MFNNICKISKNKNFGNILFFTVITVIFILGIYFRTRLNLYKAPFWLDEMMLSLSFIDRDIGGMFFPLEANQKAPPLFLCLVFISVKIFGFNEYAFRFVPYISGILSMFGFYFLLKEFVKDKIGAVFGIFLYAFSIPLIFYCAEFKPYSTDVLISILLIYSYRFISFKNISNLKIILYTLLSVVFVFLSFPSMFIIVSIVLAKYIEEKKITNKTFFILGGVIFSGLWLYFFDVNVCHFMKEYWFSEKSFIQMFLVTIKYLLYNYHHYFIFQITPIIIIGFLLVLKENKYRFFQLIILICLSLIFSLLKIYPFSERLALYFLPVSIIMIVKLFDLSDLLPKYKFIYRIFLLIIIFSILKVNIPFLTVSYESMIDFRKPTDRVRSLESRSKAKEYTLFVLDNFKLEDKILASEEFIFYTKYYKKYYNYKKNIAFSEYDKDWTVKVNKTSKKFIKKNEDFYKLWFWGRDYECYFRDSDSDYIIENLKKDYKINFFEGMYLIYTLD